MSDRFSRRVIACALLATTALTLPTALQAETPAPKFIDTIDGNAVDLATGLPSFSIEEGGIGSGPGRVAMQRIWAEGAGFLDNWTGGLYAVTTNSVTKMYVQFGGISDTFSGSAGSWTSDKADGATLVQNADATWTYTARDGTKINFDSAQDEKTFACPGANPRTCQVPLSITKPNGLKFTLSWDFTFTCTNLPGEPCAVEHDFQRLHSVSSSAGYSLTIAYASDTATTGMTSTAPWYTRTTITFNNSVNAPSPLPTITYAHPSSTEVDVTDPAGRTWKFFTDSSSRLTGIQRPGSSSSNISYAYGVDGTVNSSTKDGVTNSYSRSIVGSTATETLTNSLSQQTIVTSDTSLGRPTSYQDALSRMTSQTYDANARLTQVTAPEGNYAQYAYDARGNVTSTTNVAKSGSGLANIVTSASFDAPCMNIVKCNKPNSTTDAKGNVTNYTYDATHGGVLTVTQPAPTTGAVQPQTRYSYTQVTSASGDLVYMLTGVSACQTTSSCTGAADETKMTAAYNSSLLPTSVTRGDGTGALTATTAYAYDNHGNVSTVDGPLAGTADTTKLRYDSADQLIGVTSPNPGNGQPNRAIRLTYRTDGQVSKRELGTVTDQSDAAWASFATAQTQDIGFDSNNRPITSQLSAGGTAYSLTQTSYDAVGRANCAAVRMNASVYGSLPSDACTLGTAGSYGNDRISQTVYDAAGQVTQNKVAVGTSDAATESTLTYSNNGKLRTLTDGENNKTTYVYDGFDRLLQTQYPSGTKGGGASNSSDYEQLGYDAGSNVTSRRLRDGTSISYTYDNLNRVTLKTLPSPEAAVSFSYDLLGHLTGASQNGYNLTFGYDALGRQTSDGQGWGTISRQFDLAGRVTRITWQDGFYATYDRLVTGEISAVRENGATSGVGVLATYAYDNLGNRTSLTFGNGVVQSYAYDPVSRLTTLTHDLPGTANDLTIGGSSTPISYNPASQITSAPRTSSNTSYSFGGYYNVNRGYTANGLNQYSAAGTASFTYDARGNLTSDGTNSYTYSSENLLKTASGGISLYYDPLGRLSEYDTTSSTRFMSDGPSLAVEVDGSSNILRRYVRGDGTDELLVWYEGSGTTNRRFLSSDERSSVVSATDSSGNLVGVNNYDEYGIPGSSNIGRFQYTGQASLPELGLQYSKARIYSPTLGRFLQTDPIGYDDGLNWYNYVRSDPVNGTDTLGLTCNDLTPEPGGFAVTGRCPGGGSSDQTCGASYFYGWWYECFATPPSGIGGPLTFAPPGFRSGGPGGAASTPAPAAAAPATPLKHLPLPTNSMRCTIGRTSFWAPPSFNVEQIYLAGQEGGLSGAGSAVGQFGAFDFQRSRDASGQALYISAYKNVANVAVGIYLAGAGYGKSSAQAISDTYAFLYSKNYGDPNQATFRNAGIDAAKGVSVNCHKVF